MTPTAPPAPVSPVLAIDSAIVDSGSRNFYLASGVPCSAIDTTAPQVHAGTVTGQPQTSSASCRLHLYLPVRDAHVMPGFKHSLIGIGRLCDENCTVLLTKHTLQVFDP